MAHTRLCFKATDQDLKLTNPVVVATGSANSDEVQFVLDSAWDEYTVRTAVFLRTEPRYSGSCLLDSNNVGIIPAEALSTSNKLFVGVIGAKGDETKASKVVGVQIVRGAMGLEATFLPPNSEVYAEILQRFARANIEVAERYAKGTENGIPVTSGEGYHDNAKYYKELAESARDTTISAKNEVQVMKETVEAMISSGVEGIYGARFSKTSSSGTHTRNASNLTYRRYIGNNGTTQTISDFRNVGWWALVKNVLKNPSDNTLVAVEGDSNFEALKATNEYNLMVRFPKYYYDVIKTVENSVTYVEFVMSLKPFGGCKVLKCFENADYVDISAFMCDADYNSKFRGYPKISTTISTFTTQLNNKSLRLPRLIDTYVWLIPLIIETASLNNQSSVGSGCSSLSYGSGDTYKIKEARTSSNEVVILKSRAIYVGETVQVGSNYYNGSVAIGRLVTAVNAHPSDSTLQVLTLDGDAITTTTDMFCTAIGQRAPSLEEYNAMGKNCGYYLTGSESHSHVYVYGLCDPWANCFEVQTGLLRYNKEFYRNWTEGVTPVSSVPADGWEKLDYIPLISFADGYIGDWDFWFDEDGQLIIMATNNGGSSNNPIGDYQWGMSLSDLRYPWLGGNFGYGTACGSFCLNWGDFGHTDISCSARSVGKS